MSHLHYLTVFLSMKFTFFALQPGSPFLQLPVCASCVFVTTNVSSSIVQLVFKIMGGSAACGSLPFLLTLHISHSSDCNVALIFFSCMTLKIFLALNLLPSALKLSPYFEIFIPEQKQWIIAVLWVIDSDRGWLKRGNFFVFTDYLRPVYLPIWISLSPRSNKDISSLFILRDKEEKGHIINLVDR